MAYSLWPADEPLAVGGTTGSLHVKTGKRRWRAAIARAFAAVGERTPKSAIGGPLPAAMSHTSSTNTSTLEYMKSTGQRRTPEWMGNSLEVWMQLAAYRLRGGQRLNRAPFARALARVREAGEASSLAEMAFGRASVCVRIAPHPEADAWRVRTCAHGTRAPRRSRAPA